MMRKALIGLEVMADNVMQKGLAIAASASLSSSRKEIPNRIMKRRKDGDPDGNINKPTLVGDAV